MDATVQAVQRALIARGILAAGQDDGAAGPRTWAAISQALNVGSDEPATAPASSGTMTTSPAGRKLIRQREGEKLTAYPDSIGVWTIGVGHTSAAGAPTVVKGLTITADQSDEILSRDLKSVEKDILDRLQVTVTQNQFDALVSLVFNIGIGNFGKSTLLKKINAGDKAGAAAQFAVWNKAGGKALAGLTTRREAERKQFLTA